VAVVVVEAALPKLTVPGPDTSDQATVTLCPAGSLALPVSVSVVVGRVMVCAEPAETTGFGKGGGGDVFPPLAPPVDPEEPPEEVDERS
jgi:hypothetical protein